VTAFFFDHALLPAGWARDVRIDVADGTIVAVQAGSSALQTLGNGGTPPSC